jgi:enediyne biosynthesis protein E7
MPFDDSLQRRLPGPDAPVALGIDPPTLRALRELRQRYGNLVAVVQPNGRNALFVNEPDVIRGILVRQHNRYRKGPGFERVKMLLGNGLIVSDGDSWRRSRTMIQPAFARANLQRLIPLMADCTRRLESKWSTTAMAGGTLNITQETSTFALELILRSIFGPDYERRIVTSGTNPFAFLSEDSTRDLRVVLKVRELRELLLSIVVERRSSKAGDEYDFLSVYLDARDKSGEGFSDEELLDELVTLIVAGYETSAGTLNWAWYLLAGHPEVSDKVVDEGRRQLAGGFDAEAVAGMTYTQAVLEETLRLYPPVWLFTRRAAAEDACTDFAIPPGTDIYLSPYLLHRSAEYWPEPEQFRPERFLAAEGSRKAPWPYFPFSLGPRRCLGEYFSFLEMKIHLGLLARKFVMQRQREHGPGLDLGINLRSNSDIVLRPTPRHSPQ